nr:hypothetical protein [Jejuia pallidilutea]
MGIIGLGAVGKELAKKPTL